MHYGLISKLFISSQNYNLPIVNILVKYLSSPISKGLAHSARAKECMAPKGPWVSRAWQHLQGLEVRAPKLLVLKMSPKLFLVLKYLVILMYLKTCENMQ